MNNTFSCVRCEQAGIENTEYDFLDSEEVYTYGGISDMLCPHCRVVEIDSLDFHYYHSEKGEKYNNCFYCDEPDFFHRKRYIDNRLEEV